MMGMTGTGGRVFQVAVMALLVGACARDQKGPPAFVTPPGAPAPRTAPVGAGDRFPVLALNDHMGNMVSLREVTSAGDAILVFHPGDAEAESRPVYPWVKGLKSLLTSTHSPAEILVITTDPVEGNAAVARREDLHCGILHDPDGVAARSFGVASPTAPTTIGRVWTVVLGREGRVLACDPGLPQPEQVLMLLRTRTAPGKDDGFLDMLK